MVVTLVLMLALPFGFSDCLSPTTTPSLLSRPRKKIHSAYVDLVHLELERKLRHKVSNQFSLKLS